MPECGSIAGKHWRIAALGTALATMLLLSIGAPFAADEGAGTAPKYPPYPEVWGYTLPVPGDGSQFVRESPYQAGNGAVFYRVYTKPRLGDAEPTYRILDFFARRLREIGKQADLRFRTGGEYRPLPEITSYDRGVILPDGGRVEKVAEIFSNCRDTWDIHFRRRNSEDEIVEDRMVLALYGRPVRISLLPRCNLSGSKDHFFADWRQVSGAMTPLGDGTFILDDGIFLIRFRPDLTSPYIDANPGLFLVDRSDVLKVVNRALYSKGGQPIQRVNDAVYRYLLNLKKETER